MRRHQPQYTGQMRILISIMGFWTFILVGFLLHQLQTIILPLVVAIFGTIILNPLIDQITRLSKNKIFEVFSIIVVLILLFFALNVLGYLFFLSLKKVAVGLPDYDAKLRLFIENFSNRYQFAPDLLKQLGIDTTEKWDWEKTLGNFSISETIVSVLGSVFNFISRTFLVIIYMLFILLGRGNLKPKLSRILPPERVKSVQIIVLNIEERIQRYLIAKTIISLVTGILAGIVLFAFKVDFALTWAILTVLLNFIPTIGSAIATILPVLIAFLSTGALYPAFPVLLLLAGIQFLIGNIIDPRVVGDIVDVSPVAVLVGLIFWGWLWGIIGMFLAVPIIVSIKLIFENFESLRFISVLLSGRAK